MRMTIRPAAALLAIAATMLAALAAAPAGGAEGVWLRAGKRHSLSSLEANGSRPAPGRFSVLCSAREVRSLAVADDTLWIGTEGGLFACPTRDDAIVPVSGPRSISVTAIAADGAGALWIGGDHGISVRSNGAWTWYPEESAPLFSRVSCIVPGETRLWIGSDGNGCGFIAGGEVAAFSAQDSLLDERVLAIAEENSRAVYFGTASGLMCADSLGWKSLRYGSRLPIGAVRDALFDEDGNLFIAIAGQGVAVYSFGRVRSFVGSGAAPGEEVHALSLDATGRVWAAGASGISVFDGAEWTWIVSGDRAPKKRRFLSLRHDVEGICYAGTDDGAVLVISGHDVKELAVPQSFPERRVARIHASGGPLWLVAGSDIYSYSAREAFVKTARPPGLYASEITDLIALENGEIWSTTRFGILHYVGRAWEVFDRKSGLATEHFTRVVRDPAGVLWFATFEGGLVTRADGAWRALGREDNLPAGAIVDLALDPRGNPWIVTRTGEVAHRVQGVWARLELPRPAGAAADTARAADALGRLDPAIRFMSDAGRGAESSAPGSGYCLGFDRTGNCLVGAPAGVYCLGTSGWQLLELPGAWKGRRATAVLGAANGDVMLGTAGGGVLVWRNGDWSRIAASSGLSDNYIRALREDRGGAIWIGTQYGGVTKYTPPAR